MFSLIFPLDPNRLEQFTNTKRVYDKMPQKKEFIIPTRNEFGVGRYLDDNGLMKDVRLFPYTTGHGFNVSKALNIGVRNAQYDQVIITSPEVMPKTNVLTQLEEFIGQNIICQVWDQNEEGQEFMSLVHSTYRHSTPAYYFLAMFNKSDIEKINGWDEDFMQGYAYEDDDFGERWVRADLPFSIRDDIQAVHQYHPRHETIVDGTNINQGILARNNTAQITYCKNGLVKI